MGGLWEGVCSHPHLFLFTGCMPTAHQALHSALWGLALGRGSDLRHRWGCWCQGWEGEALRKGVSRVV